MGHYNDSYFDWQKSGGELAGLIDAWKFASYIKQNDKVLDFGCGGGYLLDKLICYKRYGVEINPKAIKEAQKKNIEVYKSIDEIPELVDKIISHHALEHIDCPFLILKKFYDVLKDNGLVIVVVPIDDWRNEKKYIPNDINQHLYTWTPLLLSNLLVKAGFKIIKVEILHHAWIPWSRRLYYLLPKKFYHFLCNCWSYLIKSRQIRIVATKQ